MASIDAHRGLSQRGAGLFLSFVRSFFLRVRVGAGISVKGGKTREKMGDEVRLYQTFGLV